MTFCNISTVVTSKSKLNRPKICEHFFSCWKDGFSLIYPSITVRTVCEFCKELGMMKLRSEKSVLNTDALNDLQFIFLFSWSTVCWFMVVHMPDRVICMEHRTLWWRLQKHSLRWAGSLKLLVYFLISSLWNVCPCLFVIFKNVFTFYWTYRPHVQ